MKEMKPTLNQVLLIVLICIAYSYIVLLLLRAPLVPCLISFFAGGLCQSIVKIKRDKSCKGKELFKKRALVATTISGVICQCPQGSLCDFFDKENETCLYGKI